MRAHVCRGDAPTGAYARVSRRRKNRVAMTFAQVISLRGGDTWRIASVGGDMPWAS